MPPVRSREIIEASLPLLFVLITIGLGYLTLAPFLPALLWGVFLSVSFYPLHTRLAARLNGRRLGATLLLGLLMTLMLVLPMVGLARALVAFIPEALGWVMEAGSPVVSPDPGGLFGNDPGSEIGRIWQTVVADLDQIRDRVGADLQPVARWMVAEGRLIGTFALEFILGVLIACVLLHRADPIAQMLGSFAERVGGAFGAETLDRAVLTIRSTVVGILGSAAAQTAVAAVAYWFVDAPHWPILALVTFILGMLQVGPVLVWLPVAIWLWSTGETGLAIFMVAWGIIPIGLVDNLVKTAVMSRGAQLPAILAFLGAIGGLFTWGIVGIFLGPVIVAVCHQLFLRWLEDERPAAIG